MKTKQKKITTLFIDVGGVLLTNGWDTHSRKLAAQVFNLDVEEMEARHHLIFEVFESGKMSLEEYLHYLIFYQKRAFSRAQFKKFIFDQSKSYPQMIELIRQLKIQHGLKIVAVNNEPREINDYRIKKFKMTHFIDVFLSSCILHLRKPDCELFRLALEITQAALDQIIYIDDKELFIKVAARLGIKGIVHSDYQSTIKQLAKFGLSTYKDIHG